MVKVKFNCKYCNKEVIDYPSNKNTYCSLKCRNKDYTGKNNPNFNNKWDSFKKKKLSDKILNEYKRGRVVWNKDLTKEDPRVMKYVLSLYGNKFGIKNKGRKSSWTVKKNLENNPMNNPEAKQKANETIKRLYHEGKIKAWNKCFGDYISGEKNPNWRGGISFEPYSPHWTKVLKNAIRQRDSYICQICSKKGISVHHIDYDKKNCDPNNLITLCGSCHMKTGYNREKWLKFFKAKLISVETIQKIVDETKA